MGKRREKTEQLVKGDRLRDLILLVHLNNKYGKGKNVIPELKEIVGYGSPGGIYSALDSSGYFERDGNNILLSERGKDYLKHKILPQFKAYNPFGNFLIFMGLIFLLQWVWWTYLQSPMIIQWHGALVIIGLGLFVRFFMLRVQYWIIRKTKRVEF